MSQAQSLDLRGISVDYGRGVVVADLDLHVGAGRIAVLLGQSGCGKSTTLRVIAGLLTPSAGSVHFGDDDVTLRPPWQRNLGLVFQNHALFPHLSVQLNVEYGLRAKRVPRRERAREALQMLEMVHMDAFAKSMPSELSGGQSQRVALARALVSRPRLLLLDEPFSSLDANLRDRMRAEVTEVVRQVGVTTVMVTHDQDEALSMADDVAVMSAGRIVEVGPPAEIYSRPRNAFTARFVGASNFIRGVVERDQGEVFLTVGDRKIPLDAEGARHDHVALAVKPEHILVNPPPSAEHRFPATLEASTFHGAQRQLVWRVPALAGLALRARTTDDALRLSPGDVAEIGWYSRSASVVADDPIEPDQ